MAMNADANPWQDDWPKDVRYMPAPITNNLGRLITRYAEPHGSGRPGCIEQCTRICEKHGIREIIDLKMLAKRVWLGDLGFPANVALRLEMALETSKIVDEVEALENRVERKPWYSTFHFNLSLESMEYTCATYGILAALLLTMNVASFGSVTADEWETVEENLAVQRCNSSLFNMKKHDQTLEDCAEMTTDITETWFVVTNFLATIVLLIVCLFSSWLYLAFSVPAPDRTRPDEVQAVVARFSGEFLMLNTLFCLSVLASCVGLLQFMQIKLRSWDLFVFVASCFFVAVLLIGCMGVWIFWEIRQATIYVKLIRDQHAQLFDDNLVNQKDEAYKIFETVKPRKNSMILPVKCRTSQCGLPSPSSYAGVAPVAPASNSSDHVTEIASSS